jgi:hypothetical protein
MSDSHFPSYEKISNSQVLLHPNPRGIIQFVGGFVFGSFPAWSYKYLLQFLFDQGYSIILYKFPFNLIQFNHWEVSLELLKEQSLLKTQIVEFLRHRHQPIDVVELYAKQESYLWLGHSLGCKYIILLEILSNQKDRRKKILNEALGESAKDILGKIENEQANLEESINPNFIRDQPSILLAPEISNTVRFLRSSWRVSNNKAQPNQQQTESLIRASNELFNLTGIISFSQDEIAEDDVVFLREKFQGKNKSLYQEIWGWHFEPLSIRTEGIGGLIVNFFDKLKL